jgi:hypothetical protein
MTKFSIKPLWLNGDDSEEEPTFAEIDLAIEGVGIGNLFDPDTSETAIGPRMPVVLLATGIVDHWWRLLNEPQRSDQDQLFELRHRLDSLTPGYVFPPLAIWSSGEAIIASLSRPDTRFQRQMFLLPERKLPWTLPRNEVETSLGAFVEATIERMSSANSDASYLRGEWQRIVDSVHDSDEHAWCVNAGRLGFDPYDPATPNLNRIGEGLSDSLFADICEAADPADLGRTCQWVRNAAFRLQNAPAVPIKAFGTAPRRALDLPGWRDGYGSAKLLRSRLNLPLDPLRSVEELLGDAATNPAAQLDDESPITIRWSRPPGGLRNSYGSVGAFAAPASISHVQSDLSCLAVQSTRGGCRHRRVYLAAAG